MNNRTPRRAKRVSASSLTDLLKLTATDTDANAGEVDVISLAGDGSVDQLLFLAHGQEAAKRAADVCAELLGAGKSVPAQGLLSLRERLCARLAAQGIQANAMQVLLTAGPDESLSLIIRYLLEPGDAVLVQQPAHPAALGVMRMRGLRMIPLPCDGEGPLIADAERLMQSYQPKLIYAVPTLGAPDWSVKRRIALLELSRRDGTLIVEDNPYGDLCLEEVVAHSLFALDQQAGGSGVLQTGRFSASFGASLRTGWIIGPDDILLKLAEIKASAWENAAAIEEAVKDECLLDQWLQHADIDAHMRRLRECYADRLRRLSSLLQKQHWSGVRWSEPKGGMFLWLELPAGLHAEALLRCAASKGVRFDPGAGFYASHPQRNRLRLNVANADGEQLEEGAARLAEAVNEFLARGL